MKELISNKDRTVVIVSHNISTLSSLCDRVMWMHDGEIMKSCIDYIYKISGSCILGKKYGEIDDWSEQGFNISELNGRWTEI